MRQWRVGKALRSAIVAIVGILVAFGVMYALGVWFAAGPSPAILAAAITLGLMRRAEPFEPQRLLRELVTLPLVALAAGAVGHVLVVAPVAGAVLFCTAIALSVWLRQFGPSARAAGRTIALPLLAILVVPVHVQGSTTVAGLLLIAAGVVALLSASLLSWIAERLRVTGEPAQRQASPAQLRTQPQRTAKPTVMTRMALQMLTALALAFAIGLLAFPAHWPWIVLTAFIVCSGALGRGDALYKGMLRLGGAVAGTLLAALAARVSFPNGEAYATTVFAILFAGIWLRQLNYAYWAACVTLIFALLQGAEGANVPSLFALRLLCILIGALCAVAATWFVYPIRTEQIVRRRVADALAALRDIVTGSPDGEHAARLALIDFHAAQIERVAPPVRLHRTVFGKKGDDHPATWIDLMHRLLHQARTPNFDRSKVGGEMRRLVALLRNKEPPAGPPETR